MGKNKYESDLSIEDLLKAVEQDPTQNNNAYVSENPIFSFIENFKITHGTTRVSPKLLYKLYRAWNKKHIISQLQFNKEFTKYYPQYTTNPYYLLNSEIAKLVEQIEKLNKPKKYSVKYKSVHQHFNRFLNIHNIKPGKLFIEADVFYHVYDTWAYRNKIRKNFSYERFATICELYFDSKFFDGSEVLWFSVDESIKQHISTQAVTNWRQGRKRRGKKSKVNKEDEDNIIYPETQAE
jgi:hypothetical protein